jgi:WD40 repeat protein
VNNAPHVKKSDLWLWDLRMPAASRHLVRTDVPVGTASFRADGRVLAYSLGGTRVALLDLQTRDPPRVVDLALPVADDPGNEVQRREHARLIWAPGGATLAAVCVGPGNKGKLVFWDMEHQEEIARWNADFDVEGLTLAFHPDGRRVVVGDRAGTIRCFDLAGRYEAWRLEEVHPGGVEVLCWDADGRLISSGRRDFNTLKVWQTSGPPLATATLPIKDFNFISALAFCPDARLAALHFAPRAGVAILDPGSGRAATSLAVPEEVLAEMPDGELEIRHSVLRFRPDGKQLAFLSDRQCIVWDMPGGQERARIPAGSVRVPAGWFQASYLERVSKPKWSTFLADGRVLTAMVLHRGRPRPQERRLAVFDLLSGQEVGPGIAAPTDHAGDIPFDSNFHDDIYFSANARLLRISGSPSPTPITVWDVTTGALVCELAPPADEGHIFNAMADVSPDGRWLCTVAMPYGYRRSQVSLETPLIVWDVAAKKQAWRVRLSALPSAVEFSQDGKLLAIGYENGSVELRDVARGEEMFRWQPAGPRAIKHLAFARDAAYVACDDGKAPVRLLHLAELRRQLADVGLDW